MYVVDMHCDSIGDVNDERRLVNKYNYSEKYGQLQFFATFTPKRDTTPQQRRERLMHFLDVYDEESERLGLLRVTDKESLMRAVESGERSILVSVEGGGGFFADSEELCTAYERGLRVLGIAWDKNELASSAFPDEDTGLTKEGRTLARRAAEMGIILDVSHLSDKSFYDLLEEVSVPVIATHSNFRDVSFAMRNLKLDMAREIAKRGGVIGLNLCPSFLEESKNAKMEHILRQVDFALENLGEDVLAFGFDVDGTNGHYPEGIDEESSIHDKVIEMLLSRYPERIVEKIAGKNAIEFLKCNL